MAWFCSAVDTCGGAPNGMLATGHHWWIDKEADASLWEAQRSESDIRQVTDSWHSDIEQYTRSIPTKERIIKGDPASPYHTVWIRRPEQLPFIRSPRDILEYALEKPKGQWTPTDEGRVGRVLMALGYKRKAVRPQGSNANEDRITGWWLESLGVQKQREIAEKMRLNGG